MAAGWKMCQPLDTHNYHTHHRLVESQNDWATDRHCSGTGCHTVSIAAVKWAVPTGLAVAAGRAAVGDALRPGLPGWHRDDDGGFRFPWIEVGESRAIVEWLEADNFGRLRIVGQAWDECLERQTI